MVHDSCSPGSAMNRCYAQEGTLLEEVIRRQQQQDPMTSDEILHIFLQVNEFVISMRHGFANVYMTLSVYYVRHMLSNKIRTAMTSCSAGQ